MSQAAADLIDRLLSSDEPDTALDLDLDGFMFPHDPQPPNGATRYPANPVAPSGRIIRPVTADTASAFAALTAAGADGQSLFAIALDDLSISAEPHGWTDPKVARRMLVWYLRNLDAAAPPGAG